MKRVLIIVLFFSVFFLIISQGALKAGAALPPVLTAQVDGQQKPLILSRLSIDVEITGFVSETRMTMTFYNPFDRTLEGRFLLPLPKGAFVSGFALDVNGEMVDGVVVEKQKGRVVFDKIVRRGIDPGLVEWVKGNNFKTRVFPIFSKKSRTIMVRFVSSLDFVAGNPVYHLPLDYGIVVKKFNLDIRINPPAEPGNKKKKLNALDFQTIKGAQIEKENFLLQEDILLPVPEMPGTLDKKLEPVRLSVETGTGGETYFAATHLDAARLKAPRSSLTPRSMTIYWDTSGSRNVSKIEKELETLEHTFRRYRWTGDINVRLVSFNAVKEKPLRFTVKKGQTRELTDAIRQLDYDGGTAMGLISPPKSGSRPDVYLLFTDGDHNFGDERPAGFNAPLYIFSGSNTANHTYLKHLALETGGTYVNVSKRSPVAAAQVVGRFPLTFISASVANGSAEQLYPATVQPINGPFTITGKLNGPYADITLNFGTKGKITDSTSFRVYRNRAVQVKNSDIIRTLWAQKKIEDLMMFPRTNKKQLLETGKKYGLVTPGTSLIVLELLSDYIQSRIKPPKCLPEMRKKYEKRVAKEEKYKEKKKKNKLAELVQRWQKRVEWWKKNVPLKPDNVNRRKVDKAPEKIKEKSAISLSTGAPHPPEGVNMGEPADVKDYVQFIRDILEEPIIMEGKLNFKVGRLSRSNSFTLPLIDYTHHDVILEDPASGKDHIGCGTDITEEISAQTGGISEKQGSTEIVTVNVVTKSGYGGGSNSSNYQIDETSANSRTSSPRPTIPVKSWKRKSPYMETLNNTKPEGAYSRYLKLKKEYGGSYGFYLQCADFFWQKGMEKIALRILSNLAELGLDTPFFLQVLSVRLVHMKYYRLSVGVFEQLLEIAPGEKQTKRELALVLAHLKQYRRAIKLLYEVALSNESFNRSSDIDMIAMTELNAILPKAKRAFPLEKNFGIDPRLIKVLDADIRVVLSWDSDETDMDLMIIEPGGEKVYYRAPQSQNGGHLTLDCTPGLGPEEYMIKKARIGKYRIIASYCYGFSFSSPVPVTARLDIFTNYARENQKHETVILHLKKANETLQGAEVEFSSK